MGSSGTGEPVARARAEKGIARSPFLEFRADGEERRFTLDDELDRVSIGRGSGIDLRLDFDDTVSALHAELERLGMQWVVSDDGLSRHGTYLNGERIVGRSRLRDGDELRVGMTTLTFRQPAAGGGELPAAPTAAPPVQMQPAKLSERQREVLIELARPFAGDRPYPTPSTNRQIAEATHLSVDAVKRHLRILFERFGIGSLPQNEKRVRLVELALETNLISKRELSPPEP
jgi:pSer/pThr/pTyr-binding forkhead associated (FHA) protein